MDLKIYVKNNKSQISKYKKYLKEVDWSNIEVRDSEGRLNEIKTYEKREKEYKLQKSMAESVLKRVEVLTKKYFQDRKESQYRTLLKNGLEVIHMHVDRSDLYDSNIDLISDSSDYIRQKEMEMSDIIFSSNANIRDKLSSLNLSIEDEAGLIEFHADSKAPLVMHEKLCVMYPQIKDKMKAMKIDFDSEPEPKLFIHDLKPPVWDVNKHYFDQEPKTIQYYVDEIKKIRNGIILDGVYISPWMYYHINFFVTKFPTTFINPKTGKQEVKDLVATPPLRDNEWWVINDNYELAKERGEMMFLAATRRAAKTTMETSHLGMCVVQGKLELIVAGGSSKDLDVLQKNFEILQLNTHPALRVPFLLEDWGKRVELGIKTKQNKTILNSFLKIINMDGGANSKSEVFAGITPDAVIIDEIMKLKFKSQLEGLKPALDAPGGKRCVAILAGCVCKGTKVFKNNGEIVNIEDINKEDGIIGIDENSYSLEPITWMKKPEVKPCYRITFTGGHILECSDDHPILTSSNTNRYKGTFKKACDLKVGDHAYLPNVIAPFGNLKEENARLLGLLVGDGHNSFKGSELYTEGESVYNWIASNYDCVISNSFITTKGTTYRRLWIRDSKYITKKAGIIGKVSVDKTLPINWSSYDRWSLSELLAGLFDSDGSVSVSKNGNIRIRYTSISFSVIEDMKYALMKFGIHCTISKASRKNSFIKGKTYNVKDSYELSISKKEDVESFVKNIKLLSESKQISLEQLELAPNKAVKSYLKSVSVSYSDKGEYFEGKGYVKNIRRTSVSKVEFIGDQYVYNLTAGKTHTYVANGIVTHNTSGNSELAKDAFDVLRFPTDNGILSMPWDKFNKMVPEEYRTWKEREFGTFIPAQMSAKDGMVKVDSNLADFLGVDSNILSGVDIKVTDWKNSIEIIRGDREIKKRDLELYTKEVLYYPICPSDMLLSGKINPFPVTEAIMHKEYILEKGGCVGRKVFLTQDPTGKIKITDSNNQLPDYPYGGGIIDSPVVLYEDLPQSQPADYLYVSGFDDYKQDESGTDSVGSFHIYKVDVGFDRNCGKIVASYATRPDPHGKLHHQIYMLQQAFNAKCFMENADMDYKAYLERMHVADKWLMTSLDFDGDITREGASARKYGWVPTVKNKKFLFSLLINYCKRIFTEYDEDGNPFQVLGVQKIDDIGLLEEIIAYTEDANVDRCTSFMSCLGYEFYLNANYLLPNLNIQIEQRREQTKKTIRTSGNPFFGKGRPKKYF